MNAPDDSKAGTQDQRRAPRRSLISFIWFKVLGEAYEGVARSCDVSPTGIGFQATQPLTTGLHVFVEIITASGAISCVGEVMYCQPLGERFRIGLRVDTIPPNDRAAWKKVVGDEA